VAKLKPAYLISGDDDAKIDAWRARVRDRAETEAGPGALERFEARSSGPEEVAADLATLSLGAENRYLLVDGVESWKPSALEPLAAALSEPAPMTVLVLLARGTPPKGLAGIVEAAGGECRECATPKPWEMPKWARGRAAEMGLRLDADASRALVRAVGARPRRIERELETLALSVHPRGELTAEDVERLAAGEATTQAYDLADAIVAGDRPGALGLAEELRARDERPGRVSFPIVRRLREVHRAAGLTDAGASEKQVAGALRMPPWVAKRTVARARDADRDQLERALCAFADLEVGARAGEGLDEDTLFTLTLARATG
jgi:DNA polymerase-3 subunit delta